MTSTNFQCGYGNNTKNSSKVLKPPGGGSSDIFGSDMQHTPRSAGKNHFASNIFAAPEPVNKTNGESGRRTKNADSHNRLFGDIDRPYASAKNHMRSNIPIGGDQTDRKSATQYQPTPSPKTNGHTNGNGVGKIENGIGSTNSNDIEIDDSLVIMDTYNPTNENLNETKEDFKECNKNISSLISPLSDKEIKQDNNLFILNSNNFQVINDKNDMETNIDLKSPRNNDRNPITGAGVIKPNNHSRKMGIKQDGNPITGEGYKPAAAENITTVPAFNGTNQVINKNRIPPGGFSSGLW